MSRLSWIASNHLVILGSLACSLDIMAFGLAAVFRILLKLKDIKGEDEEFAKVIRPRSCCQLLGSFI